MVAPSPFKSVFYVNIGFPLKASCRSHKNYCNPQNLHHKRFLELELDYPLRSSGEPLRGKGDPLESFTVYIVSSFVYILHS